MRGVNEINGGSPSRIRRGRISWERGGWEKGEKLGLLQWEGTGL